MFVLSVIEQLKSQNVKTQYATRIRSLLYIVNIICYSTKIPNIFVNQTKGQFLIGILLNKITKPLDLFQPVDGRYFKVILYTFL